MSGGPGKAVEKVTRERIIVRHCKGGGVLQGGWILPRPGVKNQRAAGAAAAAGYLVIVGENSCLGVARSRAGIMHLAGPKMWQLAARGATSS
jgi:hypothetical protein